MNENGIGNDLMDIGIGMGNDKELEEAKARLSRMRLERALSVRDYSMADQRKHNFLWNKLMQHYKYEYGVFNRIFNVISGLMNHSSNMIVVTNNHKKEEKKSNRRRRRRRGSSIENSNSNKDKDKNSKFTLIEDSFDTYIVDSIRSFQKCCILVHHNSGNYTKESKNSKIMIINGETCFVSPKTKTFENWRNVNSKDLILFSEIDEEYNLEVCSKLMEWIKLNEKKEKCDGVIITASLNIPNKDCKSYKLFEKNGFKSVETRINSSINMNMNMNINNNNNDINNITNINNNTNINHNTSNINNTNIQQNSTNENDTLTGMTNNNNNNNITKSTSPGMDMNSESLMHGESNIDGNDIKTDNVSCNLTWPTPVANASRIGKNTNYNNSFVMNQMGCVDYIWLKNLDCHNYQMVGTHESDKTNPYLFCSSHFGILAQISIPKNRLSRMLTLL